MQQVRIGDRAMMFGMDCVVLIVLAWLGIKDFKERELSLSILLGMIFLGIIFGLYMTEWRAVALGSIPGLLLCMLALLLPESIGTGDGLVAISYGLLYGWKRTCIWLMISFCLLAVSGSIYYFKERRKDIQIAFIPFLFVVHVGLCL